MERKSSAAAWAIWRQNELEIKFSKQQLNYLQVEPPTYGSFCNFRLSEVNGVRPDKSCSKSALYFSTENPKGFEILNYYLPENGIGMLCSWFFFLAIKGMKSNPPKHCDCYCKNCVPMAVMSYFWFYTLIPPWVMRCSFVVLRVLIAAALC